MGSEERYRRARWPHLQGYWIGFSYRQALDEPFQFHLPFSLTLPQFLDVIGVLGGRTELHSDHTIYLS